MKELNDIPKNNPFRVPENYFGELESRILEKTAGEPQKKAGKPLIRRLLPYLAAAASVALLAVIGFGIINRSGRYNGQGLIPEISVNEVPDNYLYDIDILTLENTVSESGITFAHPGVTKADIIDYLVHENIDVSEIYDNL